jgi:hypothetical protein
MIYKGRPSLKTISREFTFVVEILVPESGLGSRERVDPDLSITCAPFIA